MTPALRHLHEFKTESDNVLIPFTISLLVLLGLGDLELFAFSRAGRRWGTRWATLRSASEQEEEDGDTAASAGLAGRPAEISLLKRRHPPEQHRISSFSVPGCCLEI